MDISDPKNIIFEVFIDLKIQAWQLAIDDTILYAGSSYGDLYAIDISNPKIPIIGDYWNFDSDWTFFSAKNGFFYISSITNPVVGVYQLVNLDSLKYKTNFSVPGGEGAMTIQDSLLIFATSVGTTKSSLVFYTLSDPLKPKYLSTFEFFQGSKYPNYIKVIGNIAYVTDEDSRKIFIIDILDIYHPVLKNVITSLEFWPTKLVKRNKHLYVASLAGLQILSGIEPDSLKEVGMYVTGGLTRRLAKRDSILFVASEYVGLSLVNVSDPVSPKRISNALLWGKTHNILIDGDYAYVANDAMSLEDTSSGIWIVDIKNVYIPKIISHIPNVFQDWYHSAIASIKKKGNKLFVLITNGVDFPNIAVSDTILKVYDIQDVANPRQISFFRVPNCDPPDIEVNDSLIFLSLADQKLKILQYSNSGILEKKTIPYSAHGLILDDSILYIISETLRVLNVNG